MITPGGHVDFPAEFEQQVRECLSRLYDYLFLQDHPLVQKLVPDRSGPQRVQIFRKRIIEGIESLRPAEALSLQSKASRLYNILVLRYVNQIPVQDVMQRMALSERQFYREHPKAILTLCEILWYRLSPSSPTALPIAVSISTEVERIQQGSDQPPVELEELLRGAIEAVQILAHQHHLSLHYIVRDTRILLSMERTPLRQTVLWILSNLIHATRPEGNLSIFYRIEKGAYTVRFLLDQLAWSDSEVEKVFQQTTVNGLLSALNGELIIEVRDVLHLTLRVPLQQHSVLLIDDNPGVLALFQRYLNNDMCAVLVAQDGDIGIDIARRVQPRVIVLDVMLPGQDGWEVLQNLKTHPTTKDIPVFVCSVLDMPSLALSLGAEEYLRKPPGYAEFQSLMSRWLE
jgi:CheY-like chemotaxis protein